MSNVKKNITKSRLKETTKNKITSSKTSTKPTKTKKEKQKTSSCSCNFRKSIFILAIFVTFFIVFFTLLVFCTTENIKWKDKDTIGMQINKLDRKTDLSNFKKNTEATPKEEDEVDLPVVDQKELAENYEKNFEEIIIDLDEQIQLLDKQELPSIQIIQDIKERAMKEIVPKQYQSLHLDLVLTLDLIIDGDIDQAKKMFDAIIKRKI